MIQLRNATIHDAAFVARMIFTALHIDTEGNDVFLSHMQELVLDEGTLYHWSRAVVATDDDAPVGMILAYDGSDYHERRLRSFSFVCSDGCHVLDGDNRGLLSQPDESSAGEYYIDSLAVLSACRGKGIGSMLLRDAVERAQSLGLTPTILVLPDNKPAVRLYESVGFGGNELLTVFGDEYRKMRMV